MQSTLTEEQEKDFYEAMQKAGELLDKIYDFMHIEIKKVAKNDGIVIWLSHVIIESLYQADCEFFEKRLKLSNLAERLKPTVSNCSLVDNEIKH